MQQLKMTHPNVYSEFSTENHFIQSCSGKLFSQVSTDMANRLINYMPTQSQAEERLANHRARTRQLQRWFLTIHEQASITSVLKVMYRLQGALNETRKTSRR